MTSRDLEFIHRYTRLQALTFVPEVRLHLADDIMEIWHALEAKRGEAETPPPYWAFAWPGGQALARYILDEPDLVRDRRVLDVGTGSGLCAISAMISGARSAIAVDFDQFCEIVVPLNAQENSVHVDLRICNIRELDTTGFEVILAGDVCYESEPAQATALWLRAMREHGKRLLIGDPGRQYFPSGDFTRLAHYPVPVPQGQEDRDLKWAGVYTYHAKSQVE